MPSGSPAPIVDVLGFLTGTALYVMLVLMVWRERVWEQASFFDRRGRLPLLTGLCGVVWNLGALFSLGFNVAGPVIVALSFAALGCLPAVVVHSLLEGRETVARRPIIGPVIAVAYGLSGIATIMQLLAAIGGRHVPSHAALWVLTVGFTSLTILLLLSTRRQPLGRRGVWVAALSIFAVSALHFERHVGGESWWVDLIGHQASLPLALAILHQDYRFALADLFLKDAMALLLLMGLALGVFSTTQWLFGGGAAFWTPSAAGVFLAACVATALTFPLLRRLAGRVVDRVVLRRPDYDLALQHASTAIESAEAEADVIAVASGAVELALDSRETRVVDDPWPPSDPRLLVSGADLRRVLPPPTVLALRWRTVDAPHLVLAIGPLDNGRRVLSDDQRWLESLARLATRRLDSLRVTQERIARNLREREMQQLATEAELRALRAQLNPHFLFNALTTLGHLIQTAPPRALDTLLRLTEVLRGVLKRSTTEFTTLGEEIDLVVSYLEVERARFESRLQSVISVTTEARACLIPTLLLQPLVENAVKHGLTPRATGGTIRLTADLASGRLRVTVTDSGLGFDASGPTVRLGVGLANVAGRLRAHYGDAGSLTIESALGQGTIVRVELPVATHEAAATRRLRSAG